MTKASKTPRAKGWTWADNQGQRRDQWIAEGYEGSAPPRIKQLDAKTFACYRDGNYLGSEANLNDAKARCVLGKMSEKNRIMKLWEAAHPDELPPGLQLTDEERAEYWRRHPPVSRPALGAGGAAKSLPPTHPAIRNAPKAAREANTALRRVEHGKEPKGNRDAEITAMLKKGCTSEEVLRVTGWKAISMPAMAKKLGLALRIDKSGKPFRYYGEAK